MLGWRTYIFNGVIQTFFSKNKRVQMLSQVCHESGASQQWTSLHRNALPIKNWAAKTQGWF